MADRLLERTGALDERDMRDQVLDTMDLERERGITIKAQSVRLDYRTRAEVYVLNLIDTPGHVDFSYEVSRSLAACEGALLLVDAAQGIEAQTLATAYMAIEAELAIIPVVNKIDLAAADPDRAAYELAAFLGADAADVIRVSAKTGAGIDEVLEAIVHRIPPPAGANADPLQALVFDSLYDQYRGVVSYVRVVQGRIETGSRVSLATTGDAYPVSELGVRRPSPEPVASLGPGEVGYLITGAKDIDRIRVGDTVVDAKAPAPALPGYSEPKPMVFSGLFPTEGDDFEKLREALHRLRLNDSSLSFEPETSQALGFGFRCGFLGLLHMEIVQERLKREAGLDLVATAPSVAYRVKTRQGSTSIVRSPQELPSESDVDTLEEPYVKAMIIVPAVYVGAIMELVQNHRGELGEMNYLSPERVELSYLLPLAEIVFEFFDALKSRTRGFGSLDYEPIGYRASDLVRVDLVLNGIAVDAFSTICHRDAAYGYGKAMTERLSKLIPRQLFDVPIQAAIGGRVIARETLKARRKDVTAKLYGGDVTRKRKLLDKQKAGKKRMKMVGQVEIPPEAFIAALSGDSVR